MALHPYEPAIVRIRRFKNIQIKDSSWLKVLFFSLTELRKHFGHSAFSALLFSALPKVVAPSVFVRSVYTDFFIWRFSIPLRIMQVIRWPSSIFRLCADDDDDCYNGRWWWWHERSRQNVPLLWITELISRLTSSDGR